MDSKARRSCLVSRLVAGWYVELRMLESEDVCYKVCEGGESLHRRIEGSLGRKVQPEKG